MPFEVLDLAFMLLCCLPSSKSAQITAPACFRVLLSRVKSILAGFQFPNHVFIAQSACTGIARSFASFRPPVEGASYYHEEHRLGLSSSSPILTHAGTIDYGQGTAIIAGSRREF